MAFSIALFMPTITQAAWGNHTINTSMINILTINTQCDTYKEKKHLKCYCKCYNYKYSGDKSGK